MTVDSFHSAWCLLAFIRWEDEMKVNDLPMTFCCRVYGAVMVILKTIRTWSVIVLGVFLNGHCLPSVWRVRREGMSERFYCFWSTV